MFFVIALSWVSDSVTEWFRTKHLSRINYLAGENDAGMRNEREVVRPRMGHSLARRRPDYLSRSCRVSSRSHLVQPRPRNNRVPSCRPIQNGLVTPSMPELEPGSGEGQSQSREQMCNERDGRPIKTSGCRQPADHGPMLLMADGGCTPGGHADMLEKSSS